MTNTLHRFGTAETFVDDYIVIAIPSKVAKAQGDPMPALRRFLQLALEYGPVNIGDAMNGGAIRPTRHKHALQHFGTRPVRPDYDTVIKGVTAPTTFSAVFDRRENAEAFIERLAKEDLGLSINVSTSVENARLCCERAHLKRHSVGYSLGFEGISDNDPNRYVLMLSTMCGHGMISQVLARKMIDFVKDNRRSPDQVVAAMCRFCSCGIFNTSRARRIIEDACKRNF